MKTTIFKYIFFIIVFLLIGLAIYIIYSKDSYKFIGIENKNTKININEEIKIGIIGFDTINPILTKNINVQYIDKLIYNSMLTVTKDFRIQKDLLEEYSKISPLVYIIKLKENIFWHNALPLTTEDIRFTIQNLQNENIDSIYKENVKNIKDTEIIDNYTMKIYLYEETSFFEYMLTFPILSNKCYEQGSFINITDIPIGSGEYKILTISENGIDIKSAISNKTIKIKLYTTLKNLYTAFLNQEIDLIYTENIEYEKHTGKIGVNYNNSKGREFDYIAINNENDVLRQKEIRKALLCAIDRKKIIYDIYNNKYIESNFPLDYGSYLYNGNRELEYNINTSKDLLLKNGYKYSNGILEKDNKKLQFELIVNKKSEKRVFVAEEIKEQLNKIGVIIKVKQVNDYEYEQIIKTKNYDMILTGNIVSIAPDITTYFGQDNINNYKNEEIENILYEVKDIENEKILEEKYLKIIEIYNEEIPFISLYTNSNYILYNSNLKGDLSHNWYNLYYNINNWYTIL